MSYCQRNMLLPDGKPVILNLRAGNCRVSSFRPNQGFWKSPQPPPPPPPQPHLPPVSLEEVSPPNGVRELTGLPISVVLRGNALVVLKT